MPMHERPHVPLDLILAIALWALAVLAMFACAWLFAINHPGAGIVFGFSSGVLAPAAGVATVRCWLSEVFEAVRTAGNMARAANRPHRLSGD